jgi:hypothetical protein
VPALAWIPFLAACAAAPTADVIRIEEGAYQAAFDAAIEAARRIGLEPSLRDRRGGVLETKPALAPTILEPWREDGATSAARLEQTIALRRRIARFEFAPAASEADSTERAPDVLGLEAPPEDLTAHGGALDLRVLVVVEQAATPGLRASTWGRSLTTRTEIVAPPNGESLEVEIAASDRPALAPLPWTAWTPVLRDGDVERRLLADIAAALAAAD